MKNLIYLSALLAVTALSCDPKEAGPVPMFDVTQTSLPTKELILQDIATVEYIPLETKDAFLLGQYPNIHYIDDEIIVANDWIGNSGPIMFFDRKSGKAIDSFSRKGRGPGEYGSVGDIAVDRDAGEIFLTEGSYTLGRKSPLHVYDLHGKHLRSLEIRRGGLKDYLHVYDDQHLFLYDMDVDSPMPYKLISRTDTTSTHLPLKFPARDFRSGNAERDNEIEQAVYSGTNVLKTREGYIFSEPGVDTIYQWNRGNGKLTPLVALTPAFNSMSVPVALFTTGQSSDYLFFEIEECKRYDLDELDHRKYDFSDVVYDKTDGQFYECNIRNGDHVERGWVNIPNISSNPVNYPPGQFVEVIQALELVDLHEKGKLQGPLAELAATLKEDDNPVLMIATLK
jgi:hypothetical protein